MENSSANSVSPDRCDEENEVEENKTQIVSSTDCKRSNSADVDENVPDNAPTDTESPNVSEVSDTAQETNETVLEMIDITPEKCLGVMKQVVKQGEGDEFPGYGDRVFVHYTGWLMNKQNTMFDSNRKEDKLEFNLGRGMVIKGWDLAVSTMKKGEVALFVIQPNFAYGDLGNPPAIPAHTPLLFEIELYEWKLDDLSPKKDGTILRKVIDKGEGTTSPNEGSQVKVKLVGYYEDKVFEDCEKEFILSEGCLDNVLEGIELALYKFRLNEKSLIYLKSKYGFEKGSEEFNIPPDATVMYEVTLFSFEKVKDVWEMNTDEKFERSKVSKEKGISFLKAGHYKVALRQFRSVLACLEKEPGVAPESQKDRNVILLSAYLNVALCLLKMENYVDAVKFCDKALEMDPENEKAIYRRGQAKMLFNDCEEALEDFNKLLSLYPENKAAKQCIVSCKEKIKKQSMKDKSVYNKMFEIFMKQDQERMKNMKTETGVWEEGKEEVKEEYKTETQRLIERNNNFLRDANIIELSNTAC